VAAPATRAAETTEGNDDAAVASATAPTSEEMLACVTQSIAASQASPRAASRPVPARPASPRSGVPRDSTGPGPRFSGAGEETTEGAAGRVDVAAAPGPDAPLSADPVPADAGCLSATLSAAPARGAASGPPARRAADREEGSDAPRPLAAVSFVIFSPWQVSAPAGNGRHRFLRLRVALRRRTS
jgi:hypothetical protein